MQGQETIVAQRYIPEIRAGDKRILMIDGKPYPYAFAGSQQRMILEAILQRGVLG